MDFRDYLHCNKNIPIVDLETEISSLLGPYNEKIKEIFKIKESKHILEVHGSAEVEGNILDLTETKILIEDKILPDKPYKDIIETLNLNRSINRYRSIKEFSKSEILDVHRGLCIDLVEDKYVGNIRDCNVYITNTEFIPCSPEEVEFRLENALYAFKHSEQGLKDIFKLKWTLVKIHPFVDGNGRLTRLVMNALLNYRGYPRLVIEGKLKSIYYKALEKDIENWYIFCYNLMIFQMNQVLRG